MDCNLGAGAGVYYAADDGAGAMMRKNPHLTSPWSGGGISDVLLALARMAVIVLRSWRYPAASPADIACRPRGPALRQCCLESPRVLFLTAAF
jgi:hypothetical protein